VVLYACETVCSRRVNAPQGMFGKFLISETETDIRLHEDPEYSSVSVGARPVSWTTGVRFPAGAGNGLYIFVTASRPALGSIQPPGQWIRGAFTPEV
jgi:hypothetical protein